MPRRRSTPRRSERVRDSAYLAWLHTRPCEVGEDRELQRLPGALCEGAIEADHVGRRPLGRKCDDREAISLCRRHHADRHALRGVWAGMSVPERRAWLVEAVRRTQADWDAEQACRVADEVLP